MLVTTYRVYSMEAATLTVQANRKTQMKKTEFDTNGMQDISE